MNIDATGSAARRSEALREQRRRDAEAKRPTTGTGGQR